MNFLIYYMLYIITLSIIYAFKKHVSFFTYLIMCLRGDTLYAEDFTQRLTKLRMEKGVSARDMSLSLGQNSGYINHIENRQAFPSLPVFFNICEYFGISPEQFFSSKNPYPTCISSIIDDLEELNAEQLHCISVIIHDLAKKK